MAEGRSKMDPSEAPPSGQSQAPPCAFPAEPPVKDWRLPEGLGYQLVTAVGGAWPPCPDAAPGVVRIGLHDHGPAPAAGWDDFDVLISSAPDASAPWVGAPASRIAAEIDALCDAIRRQPVASAVAAQVLRMTLDLAFEDALALESLSYSMLLGSAGFAEWRRRVPRRARGDGGTERVTLAREPGWLAIRLSRPEARNAFDSAMRDQLVEALMFARDDPEGGPVVLEGEGPCFSAGGDLDEFGLASDPAIAHAIRCQQSPVRLARALGERLSVRLHGACIGAGIELPAAAHRVVAAPGAVIRLPEVSMGLIPGAGGTASLPRRIGRWRACYLILSGAALDASTALSWGLIDQLDEPR